MMLSTRIACEALVGRSFMAVAVVSEFNPFHNGHKYLLETAKNKTDEGIIAVMSGSFTQRGEVALTDKFLRAKTALKNGADLVIELPTVYAVSNAQRFAKCGVEIAKAFDCVNFLAFGCENDDIDELVKASNALDNDEVKVKLNEEMKKGNYYPRAVELAVRSILGDKTADILTSPNNILAVEYLRNLSDKVKPLPIMRKGAEHDSSITSENIASASQIRTLLRNQKPVNDYLPEIPEKITYTENLELITLYKLRSMTAEDFAKLPDVNEGLENRIFEAVNNYNSVKEIIEAVKTKRYTHARIRRIITCTLLEISEQLQNCDVKYARVLGFTSKGAEMLKSCKIEVVTSVAKALKNENIREMLEKDIYATDISSLAYNEIRGKGLDFTTPIVKV